MTTPRKPARTAAMRKAFMREFSRHPTSVGCGLFTNEQVQRCEWVAFYAGAAWQRRQKGRP